MGPLDYLWITMNNDVLRLYDVNMSDEYLIVRFNYRSCNRQLTATPPGEGGRGSRQAVTASGRVIWTTFALAGALVQ